MSTGLLIAIIVAVLLLIVLFAVLLPRMRAKRQQQKLETRRREVARAHRAEAETKQVRADYAENQARKERAEAELLEAKARMHEVGQADDELKGRKRRERDDDRLGDDDPRYADKAATVPPPESSREPGATQATNDYRDEDETVRGGVSEDYVRGREDERRLESDDPDAPRRA